MIEKFHEWVEGKHDYAKEWKKRTGGKVMGYLCTYVPEEILYAADILPVRIFGGHEPSSLSDSHIYSMYCPFCRDCLTQGLQGKYDYLDGIMIAQSCLHIRQTFYSWEKHIPTDYSYYLYMPHGVQCVGRYEYMTGELVQFKESVEKWLGKSITDTDLDRGIEIMNTNRRLTKQVYEFRKMDEPPITGEEAMEMVISSQLVDKEEHSRALEELLKELPKRQLNRETGTRLMIIGSEDDATSFLRMVEQELTIPATFVIDEECTGTRYFWNEVIPQKDRLAAIAARYLDRPPCPSKDWPEHLRFPHIQNLIKEYKVGGVILAQQKFCDPHELEIPPLRELFAEDGMPNIHLEFDMIIAAGQFRTRVEAFLETMIELI